MFANRARMLASSMARPISAHIASTARVLSSVRLLSSSTSSSSSSSSVIPVIDLKPYFEGGARGTESVAAAVRDACENTGFLTITNHGVPAELIARMENVTRRFFDLPVEVKNEAVMTETYPYGYNGFQQESLAKGHQGKAAPRDLKECFAVGPYNPAAGMPPVQWCSAPKDMPAVWHEYYQAMETLSAHMMRVFAHALRLEPEWFQPTLTRHRSCIRALNYPELDKKPEEGQIRAGAHTDYGSLTILLQDKVGGLQVLSRKGEWCDAPYVAGSYIINLGDLMSRWTNDRWVSTLHRVLPRQPRRQSIAFFHNINADHEVTCIPTCLAPGEKPKYAPIKAWDHLMEKHLGSTKY